MSEESGLNPQQEAFCHAYVYYGNAALAAREAGYEPAGSRQQGHRLLKTPAVATRIAEIRERLARESCHDVAQLLGKLENIHNRALEDRHYAAAARAVEIQARLCGLVPSLRERLAAAPPPGRKNAPTMLTHVDVLSALGMAKPGQPPSTPGPDGGKVGGA